VYWSSDKPKEPNTPPHKPERVPVNIDTVFRPERKEVFTGTLLGVSRSYAY
jgi:hypothetical protein